MKKSNQKSHIWDGINIAFVIATTITTCIFAALFILCFIVPIDSQANSFILGMCGVFASLASAFFIAFIVRYRDMKEKCQQEEKALAVMRPFLTEICTVINGFLPQINAFMTINDDDTVSYPPERVYYTDINAQEGNRNFVDFNAIFQNAGTRLSDAIEKAIKSPVIFQCNKTVANLLTNMQLNGFTNNLYEIQGTRSVFDQSSTVYMDIKKAYLEFVDIYAELVKLADYGIDPKLRVLTNVEKTEYIKEIQTIAPQLPTEKGTVYLGCKRIQ